MEGDGTKVLWVQVLYLILESATKEVRTHQDVYRTCLYMYLYRSYKNRVFLR